MGRFTWIVVIERDPNERPDRPWWVKWLIWGLAGVGLASFLIVRYVETGHI